MNDWQKIYLEASYRIKLPQGWVEIIPEQADRTLQQWLENNRQTQAALITAYNPLSQLKSKTWNREQHQRLIEATQNWTVYPAESSDPTAQWPIEHGLWITGIEENKAAQLAQQFQQRAWLQWQKDRHQLRWLEQDPN